MTSTPPLVLLDVNVVLDVLLDRKPWADAATALLSLCDRKLILGCWSATSVGTVYFLAKRELGAARARAVIADLLNILQVAPVNEATITEALAANWPDFEDAIVHACARQAGASYLVTRNPKDFRKASLRVCDPESLVSAVRSQ